ncbi:MAG: hypothetical protein C0490_07295 [Marivirga sp.]|nr:hypothetical protein [Marivirga sp.]
MARSEQQFIYLCKNQIEQKFSFGNGSGYTQRDLEVLCSHIEQKTGVIISLSTMKRLWKDSYKQSPQVATLNALAILLDYKDWQDFKLANQKKPNKKPIPHWAVPALVSLTIVGALIFWLATKAGDSEKIKSLNEVPKINGPVHFEASSTVTSGIPNTVIFHYDVSNVVADTFYIQQSWNSDHRVALNSKDSVLTSIYYESGFHRAKLIANDSVIAMRPIHVISNGWEPHIYRNDSDPELLDFKNEKFVSNGQLHIDSAILVKRNIDFSKRFLTRITNSQVFNLHSDNFSFSTRMKADRVFHQVCPWMDLVIVTDVHTFSVYWTGKGCEKYAGYKLGEISKSGKNNDLSALGCNVYEWQELKVQVKDRQAMIYLNGQPTFRETYKEDFGKIVALIYIFDGTGSIDYAKLQDGNEQVVFEDNFGQ